MTPRKVRRALLFDHEFDLELHPGLVVTRSIKLRNGAGLRVTLRDENGALVSGQYEFYDDSGNPLSLVLGVDGWISSSMINPYGTHESRNPLPPGRYRLVLLSKGYAKQSVMLELRAGEHEDVDVTLSK